MLFVLDLTIHALVPGGSSGLWFPHDKIVLYHTPCKLQTWGYQAISKYVAIICWCRHFEQNAEQRFYRYIYVRK